jgi:FMN reductase
LNLVAFCGSASRPSKTRGLIGTIIERIEPRLAVEAAIYDLRDFEEAGFSYQRAALPDSAQRMLDAIEGADILIVGSPVLKGSYSGLFKHVFDLVDPDKLLDKPVLVCACGGGYRHALVVEHQLRPLFAFFGALTVPVSVYACEKDYADGTIVDPALLDRIDLAVKSLVRIVRPASGRDDARLAALAP